MNVKTENYFSSYLLRIQAILTHIYEELVILIITRWHLAITSSWMKIQYVPYNLIQYIHI